MRVITTQIRRLLHQILHNKRESLNNIVSSINLNVIKLRPLINSKVDWKCQCFHCNLSGSFLWEVVRQGLLVGDLFEQQNDTDSQKLSHYLWRLRPYYLLSLHVIS